MFFFKSKDGGAESTVTGYWLVEIKSLFSIVLLRFDGLSREAYHTHAFNSISWVLKGGLVEYMKDGHLNIYDPSLIPVITKRHTFHKVDSNYPRTWVLSFRGPWNKTWKEQRPLENNRLVTLTNGRQEIADALG